MNSLYDISQELLQIFDEIEELDGELTPELDKKLEITREEYAQKIENYAKVVTQYKADVTSIKEEVARLNQRKKVIENRIARLEDIMLNAIQQFGPVETAKFKIGTRRVKSVELDEERISNLTYSLMQFARELHKNGIVGFGEDCDIQGILEVINADAKAKFECDNNDNNFVPYTLSDLNAVKVNISSESSLNALFSENDNMLKSVLDNDMYFNIVDCTNKTDVKNISKTFDDVTIGHTVEKVNLSIR